MAPTLGDQYDDPTAEKTEKNGRSVHGVLADPEGSSETQYSPFLITF